MRFFFFPLFLSLFLISCGEQKEQTKKEVEMIQTEKADEISIINQLTDDFDWQGHRGARGLMPENTIAGFKRALDFPKITTLELDLVVSKDNVLVVSHEPWMSASICMDKDKKPIIAAKEKEYNLYEMQYQDIAKFDCGKRGNERFPEQAKLTVFKPRLLDVVAVVERQVENEKRQPIKYNIEIKTSPAGDRIFHPVPQEFAALVIDELNRLGIKERTTIQSFDIRALQATRALDTSISLALLIENEKKMSENLSLLGFTPNIYSPYHKLVNADLIAQAKTKSIKVIPWTVNEPERMKELIALGVDGIITDYPDRIAKSH